MNLDENPNNSLLNFYEQILHQQSLVSNFTAVTPMTNERLSPSTAATATTSTSQQSLLNLNVGGKNNWVIKVGEHLRRQPTMIN